jgi:hypothetical protein
MNDAGNAALHINGFDRLVVAPAIAKFPARARAFAKFSARLSASFGMSAAGPVNK